MKTSIIFLLTLHLFLSSHAEGVDSLSSQSDSVWKDIINEIDLFYVNNALEVVRETNGSLESLLYFVDQMEGSSFTDSTGKLTKGSYQAVMADSITRIIDGDLLPLDPSELMQYRQVKIIQCNSGGWGFNEYDYFPCSISKREGRLYYEKLDGSQLKSGHLYRRDAYSYVFLGGTSANASYDSHDRIGGILYKVAPDMLFLIFTGKYEYEIHCLKR